MCSGRRLQCGTLAVASAPDDRGVTFSPVRPSLHLAIQKEATRCPQCLQAVRPSWLVRNVMRPLTRILNPISVKMAGRPGFRMAARVHHVGRRSGTKYVTPVGARVKDGQVLIPLTFGNQSDWVRNVRAAGGATVEVRRHPYEFREPQFVNWPEARQVVRATFPFARGAFKNPRHQAVYEGSRPRLLARFRSVALVARRRVGAEPRAHNLNFLPVALGTEGPHRSGGSG